MITSTAAHLFNPKFARELSLQNRLEAKHSQIADIIRTKYPCSSCNAGGKLLCTLDLVFKILYFPFICNPFPQESTEGMNFVQQLTFCHDSACGSCTFPQDHPSRAEEHLISQKDWSSKRGHVWHETVKKADSINLWIFLMWSTIKETLKDSKYIYK